MQLNATTQYDHPKASVTIASNSSINKRLHTNNPQITPTISKPLNANHNQTINKTPIKTQNYLNILQDLQTQAHQSIKPPLIAPTIPLKSNAHKHNHIKRHNSRKSVGNPSAPQSSRPTQTPKTPKLKNIAHNSHAKSN